MPVVLVSCVAAVNGVLEALSIFVEVRPVRPRTV
jgi:hypothetical protein